MRDQQEWRLRAACRDEDAELFFPASSHGPGARQAAEAKAICAGCDVQPECLADALHGRAAYGIFGGYTPAERRTLQQHLNQQQEAS